VEGRVAVHRPTRPARDTGAKWTLASASCAVENLLNPQSFAPTRCHRAPEGRLKVARRFIAGWESKKVFVPWGRLNHQCDASALPFKRAERTRIFLDLAKPSQTVHEPGLLNKHFLLQILSSLPDIFRLAEIAPIVFVHPKRHDFFSLRR
jgi:hypothetical protein